MIVDAHGLLVLERSAGKLVRADRDAKPVAELPLSSELGETGSYRIDVADGSGISAEQLDERVAEALVEVQQRPLGKAVRLEGVPWTCRGDDESVGRPLYVVYDHVGGGPRSISSDRIQSTRRRAASGCGAPFSTATVFGTTSVPRESWSG